MSNSSVISDVSKADRPVRRSTRLDEAVTVTVMGIDSWRGPYREQVSTVSISAHGCKYESKYQVMGDSLVILELPSPNPKDPPISTRARVKWVRRPDTNGDLFQTAIELEEPGNIWGIPSPPEDWPAFSVAKRVSDSTGKPHLVAVPKSESTDSYSNTTARASEIPARSKSSGALQMPSIAGVSAPVAQLMQEIQQHMERMIGQAAQGIVRERMADAMNEIRGQLRQEAQHMVTEVIAANLAALEAAKSAAIAEANPEVAPAPAVDWDAQIEAAVAKATERLESKSRELDEKTGSLVSGAADHVQRLMESKRIEEVDRFVGRLKEQLSPLLDGAQQISTDLHNTKEMMEKFLHESQSASGDLQKSRQELLTLLDDSQKRAADLHKAKYEIERLLDDSQKTVEQMALNSTGRIEEKSRELEEKFVEVIDARMFWASGEIEREARSVTEAEIERLREAVATYPIEAEAETRLKNAAEGIVSRTTESLNAAGETIVSRTMETVKNGADERINHIHTDVEARLKDASESTVLQTAETINTMATERQQRFEQEIQDAGNRHLEKVGSALSDLASVLKRFSKE